MLSFVETVRLPAVTFTSTVYGPAWTVAAGLTVTVIPDDAPALTTALAACDWPASVASTVQPVGPVPSAANVRSSDVSFERFRLKVYETPDGPRRSGTSVVSVSSPAA